MATRFYFHDALSPYSNLPTTEQANVDSDKDLDARTINRSMDDIIGPHVLKRISTLATTSNSDYYFTRFVSHPINQSGIGCEYLDL